MSAKTKIVVIKLKDLLFYATVGILCIIVLLMLYILFQPDAATTNSTIEVQNEKIIVTIQPFADCYKTLNELT